jgi:hypothetical protein
MAHGMYQIKVLKVTNNEEVLSYYACTHPVKGDSLYTDKGNRLLVVDVHHMMKEERNGGGPVYTAFSHVEVLVAK